VQSQKSEPMPPPPKSNAPFSKISISDAIGLITLRLGKIEQYVIDTQHDNQTGGGSGGAGGGFSLPENTQLIDNSVFTSIINRLDSIEKKDIQSNQLLAKFEVDLSDLNQKFNQYIIDTNSRLDDINDAFLVLEEEQSKAPEQDQTQAENNDATLEENETSREVALNGD
jgi:hypothetical protein